MKTLALLRLVAIATATTIALVVAIPADARSEWQVNQMAPHWLDQTIYRPNCLPADCACDCRSERLCLLDCVRW